MTEPRDAIVAALADRVMRRPVVVLAGGSFGTRHRLVQDALASLADPVAPQGSAYRSERRTVRVVAVDLRRDPWTTLEAATAPATDGARVVVVVEEAQRARRWSREKRARLDATLDALTKEGGERCVVLTLDGDAAWAMRELPAIGPRIAGEILRLPPPWKRRVAERMGAVGMLVGVLGSLATTA